MKLPVRFLSVFCVFAAVALTVRGQVAAPTRATNPALQKQAPADNARLRTLLTEKRDALRQIEEMRRSERQQGTGNPEDLINASLAVLGADLDLARTPRERVTLCEKRVQLRKELESAAEAERRNGTATFEAVQRVHIDRLDAEIALEREREAAAIAR